MIQWIQGHKWRSPTILSIVLLALFGALDFSIQGSKTLLPAVIFAATLALAARLPIASVSLIALGTISEIVLGLRPVATGLITCLTLFVIAAFASRLWRRMALAVGIVSGAVMVGNISFTLPISSDVYGLLLLNDAGRFTALLLGVAVVVSFDFLFWILGRLGRTQYFHVGSSEDKAVASRTQAQLAIQIAEQNERL